VKIITLLVVIFINMFASDDINISSETNTSIISPLPLKKVLYLNYEEIPKRVIKGEIFSVTIKTLSTIKNFLDIKYNFSNFYGLELLNEIPYRKIEDRYYFDTFYFYVDNNKAKLPDITAKIISYSNYKDTVISGKILNVITLNPQNDFSNVIANSLNLMEYRTTSYDNRYNIVVFEANATNTKIDKLEFKNVYKQGVESMIDSYFDSKITYFVIIDKKIENFSFSYFNLIENRFKTITIPIVVDDDSVSTQTDLKPRDQSRERLKMDIASSIAFVGFIFILWRRKYIYLIFILLPLAYMLYLSIPQKDICIKKGSNIYLLPVSNGTIFETTQLQITLKKEGEVKKFVKVKLKNNKIGWVKNEDICSY